MRAEPTTDLAQEGTSREIGVRRKAVSRMSRDTTTPRSADDAVADLDREQEHPCYAGRYLRSGLELSRSGQTEGALLAFRAALRCVLDSEAPGDLALRRLAAEHLLGLLRGDTTRATS